MKVGFAGFAHSHSISMYNYVKTSEELQLGGVFESDVQIKELLNEKGIEVTHKSLEALLSEKDIDIIAVGPYFSERGKVIIEALKAGKHVIVDKPVCTRFSEIEEIERLVKEKNLKLGCMLTMRYTALMQGLRDAVQSGKIGEIKSITYGQQHPLMYKTRPDWFTEPDKHGGCINDIAIHGIDVISFATGLRVKNVIAARTWNAFATEKKNFKDSGQFMIELSNGAGVIGDVSYSLPSGIAYGYPLRWEIFGSKGVLRFTTHSKEIELYYDEEKEPIMLDLPNPKSGYWEDFLREIRGERPFILTTDEIINSTKDTLRIQEFADNMEEKK